MQSPILSLLIPVVSNSTTPGDIVTLFYKLDIATIKRVTLLPVADVTDNVSNSAYIEIGYWHDTETAYRFIERLRDNTKECRIVYDDPLWWNVIVNHENYHVTYDPRFSSQTTEFIHAYGEEPVEAIYDLTEFFKSDDNIINNCKDYEIMYNLNLDDFYGSSLEDDYNLYKYPLLLKEQKNDCFFTPSEWNKIMDEIVEEDEEFRRTMRTFVEEDDCINGIPREEYINDILREQDFHNGRREIVLDRCY